MLVNYWWHDSDGDGALADSAFDALLHGILSIRALPPATRRAWAAFFEHYVFGDDRRGAGAYFPERRGILGDSVGGATRRPARALWRNGWRAEGSLTG